MRKSKAIPFKGKPKFAFVVDGECEYWYIQMLQRNESGIGIDLKPEIPQKKKLSDQYIKVKELSNDYDKVFWIIDFDEINSKTRSAKKGVKTALQALKEYCDEIGRINEKSKDESNVERIIVIINNPCLEFWFLLHFEPTARYFDDCGKAGRQLKRHLSDYDKSQNYFTKQGNDIYLKLKPHLDKALANAKKLGDFDFTNPHKAMTQMQLFFEFCGIKG